MPTVHYLKILPEYFEAINNGPKRFEIRKDDRKFKVGDFLSLVEQRDSISTQRSVTVRITYILHGPCFGLEAGYCIMSFRMMAEKLEQQQQQGKINHE